MKNTPFNIDQFNEMIQGYNDTENIPLMPKIKSLDDFKQKYNITNKNDLRQISQKYISEGKFKGCYIVSTSGTTSSPLIIGHRIWENVSEGAYPHQFVVNLMEHVFSDDDVVINLFTPGGLGVLYEGACRFLEPIGATILPVGPLDSLNGNSESLNLFRDLGLNTVMGAPSSIIQFARESEHSGINFNIKKIIYTGEEFFTSKKEIISKIWPSAKYYSLFGAVEYGFAAMNVPTMPNGLHEIMHDWYFVETDDDGNILITDLTFPLVPIIRYRIGDKGRIQKMPASDSKFGLIIDSRSDSSFNISGNAVSYERVRDVVRKAIDINDHLQIILETDNKGFDLLTLASTWSVDTIKVNDTKIRESLFSISEISEGIERGTLSIAIVGDDGLIKNSRNKTGNIVDFRKTNISINKGNS
ncbi:hypothetical protein V6259_19265 [Marinomonas sp. TI.3.20]|uniref:hypothetical protein n=1 Tax=Marinomonas sp. TI.3.20 TaxID=3121296 RepID=UPI00311FBDDF